MATGTGETTWWETFARSITANRSGTDHSTEDTLRNVDSPHRIRPDVGLSTTRPSRGGTWEVGQVRTQVMRVDVDGCRIEHGLTFAMSDHGVARSITRSSILLRSC